MSKELKFEQQAREFANKINKVYDTIDNMSEAEQQIFRDYEDTLKKVYYQEGNLAEKLERISQPLRVKFGNEWPLFLRQWRVRQEREQSERVNAAIRNIETLSIEDRQVLEQYHEKVGDVFAHETQIPDDLIDVLLRRFGSRWRVVYNTFSEQKQK